MKKVESQLVGTNEVIIGLYESLIKPFTEKNKVSDIATKILEKIQENLPFEPIFIKVKPKSFLVFLNFQRKDSRKQARGKSGGPRR